MNKTTISEKFSRSNWSILILFGLVGQIAWSVENMYFNLFVYDTIAPDLDTVTLMVQLSGIMATVATLVAGVISDKVGNRRSFISWGYAIWGVTVAMFGFMSPELTATVFGMPAEAAVRATLIMVVVGDCVMTLFGSTANDAAFNAWLTDNTKPSFRGTVEGVVSILPLVAMLVVAGGFGIIKDLVDSRPAGVPCAMNTIDVGIAVGSACATASDLRLDTRVMYSAGYAAKQLGWLDGCNFIIAIPVSASSKNPFFDRKRKV